MASCIPGTAEGLETMLLFAGVPIVDREMCLRDDWYGDDMTDNMFCAGFAEGGKDTCQV